MTTSVTGDVDVTMRGVVVTSDLCIAINTFAISRYAKATKNTGSYARPPINQRVGVTKSRLKRTIPQLSTINPSATSRSPEGFLKPV